MSKFLRQMAALSKKPEDFPSEKSSGAHVSVPPTDSTRKNVSVPPTDTSKRQIYRRPRLRQARLAQDGHSHAEQSIYAALWAAGTPDPDGNRIVTMGLGRLSKAARLSENNCRLNIRSLKKKLALAEVGSEDSRAGIGKTYKVYSYTAILALRRAAGLEWVIRTKGVAFVNRPENDVSVPPTDTSLQVESVGGTDSIRPGIESVGGPPTDSVPPYRKSFRNTTKEASSSADSSLLIDRLAHMGIHLDDDAGRRMIGRCQSNDHTATVDEIAAFAELKVRQLAKRRDIENWPGLLMAAVPAYFAPPATELSRYREGKRQDQEREERIARQVLEDEQSTQEERAWARSVLSNPESVASKG